RWRIAHHSIAPTRNRWFADSPLEQAGFEPLVPSVRGTGRAARVRLRWSSEHRPGAARRSWRHAPDEVGPPVRSPFAPAKSLQTLGPSRNDFEHQADAERFQAELRDRLAQFAPSGLRETRCGSVGA